VQGYRREAVSEGSIEQTRESMDKTEYKAQASDERATYREVHIHQRCKA